MAQRPIGQIADDRTDRFLISTQRRVSDAGRFRLASPARSVGATPGTAAGAELPGTGKTGGRAAFCAANCKECRKVTGRTGVGGRV